MATSTNNGTKRKPVFSKRYWPTQVAVFEFQNDGRLNHSVELTRSFRRGEQAEWETSSYLTVNELLPAGKLLAEAYGYIQARLQKEYQDRRNETQEEPMADATPF